MTLEIPKILEDTLGDTPEQAGRRALECLVIEGYRAERLTRWEVQQVLGMTLFEVEAFLAKNQVFLHYNVEDLESDVRTFREHESTHLSK